MERKPVTLAKSASDPTKFVDKSKLANVPGQRDHEAHMRAHGMVRAMVWTTPEHKQRIMVEAQQIREQHVPKRKHPGGKVGRNMRY